MCKSDHRNNLSAQKENDLIFNRWCLRRCLVETEKFSRSIQTDKHGNALVRRRFTKRSKLCFNNSAITMDVDDGSKSTWVGNRETECGHAGKIRKSVRGSLKLINEENKKGPKFEALGKPRFTWKRAWQHLMKSEGGSLLATKRDVRNKIVR